MKLQDFKFLFLVFISLPSYGGFKALHIAATGMKVQEVTVNNISHNIANLGTTAFKRSRTESADLLYATYREPGSRSSSTTFYNVGLQVGSGAKVTGIRKDFVEGIGKVTNNPFDLMIKGEGFFGLVMPNGEIRYTRNGSFNLNEEGRLANHKGDLLYPGFSFPANILSIDISEDGMINSYVKGDDAPVNAGQIPLFTFNNQVGLKSIGGGLYQATPASGTALEGFPGIDKAGSLEQGSLESSNVSIMNEMTGLITAQRAYEMNSKVMKTVDDMLGMINNIR